jgi:hypothetical protein
MVGQPPRDGRQLATAAIVLKFDGHLNINHYFVLVAAARLLDFSQKAQRDLGGVPAFGVGSYKDMGRFLLQSMMAVAELEAVSARTKAALAASNARGKKLGGFRGRASTAEDTARARAARTLKGERSGAVYCAHHRPRGPGPNGVARGIARALNEGVPTPSGQGTWTAATGSRLRQRLDHADA